MDTFSGMVQRDRWIFISITLLVLLYVVLRAAFIPWVHDESTTIYWYVERGEFLPYVALWDAGNHFLSTAIGILSYKIWGLSLLGSRIGSIVAFPIYAWAIYRIGSNFDQRWVKWITWIALLTCPFLLDFFSLFRGYGLGMAFWMVALDGGVRYFRSRSEAHLAQLLVGMALADMAVLSLVPLWAFVIASTGLIELVQWQRNSSILPWRKGMIWLLLGVLPLMLGLLLSWEMRRRGLLYHGSTEGLFEVTISSLSRYVLGSAHWLILLLASAIISGAGVIAFFKKTRPPLLSISALLLFVDLLMRVVMANILHVNYPEDRAALHMVPLTILLIGAAADQITASRLVQLAFIMPLLFLPIRSIYTINFDHTQLWPEQSVPTRFLETIEDLQDQAGKPLVIGAYHQLGFAVPYAARLHNIQISPPDVVGFPEGYHDVRIADDRFIGVASNGYITIDRSVGNGLYLLERKDPISTKPIDRKTIEQPDQQAEYFDLWRNDHLISGNSFRAEIKASIHSEVDRLNMFLVVSQMRNDSSLYHHAIPLSHFRLKWSGEQLHTIVNIPPVGADQQVVYFWNQDKVQVNMKNVNVTLKQINE